MSSGTRPKGFRLAGWGVAAWVLGVGVGVGCAGSTGPVTPLPPSPDSIVLVRAGPVERTLHHLQVQWALSHPSWVESAEHPSQVEVDAALSELVVAAITLSEARRRHIVPAPAEVEREVSTLREGDPDAAAAVEARIPGGGASWREAIGDALTRERVENAVRDELRSGLVPDPATVAARVRQALLASHPVPRVEGGQVVTRDAATAQRARDRLLAGEPLSAVARDLSQAPEARRGGSLGLHPRGTLPAFMEEALFHLAPGEVSEIVRSPFGFHVLVVLASDPGHTAELTALQARAQAQVLAERVDAAWAAWLAKALRGPAVQVEPGRMATVRCCRSGLPFQATDPVPAAVPPGP